jgi:integrase
MGHSTIQMTMNFYVHADEEMKTEEMRLIEKSLKVV